MDLPYPIAAMRKPAIPTSVLSRVYCGVQSHPDVPRQGAVRRKWHVLFKGCNNVLEHLGGSLQAGREAVTRGVTPLGKD